MSLTKTPPKVHPAFNPVIFEMSATDIPTPNVAELTVDIAGKQTTLSRPYIAEGEAFVARFDISGIVRNNFMPCHTEETPEGYIDNMLFVVYSVGGVDYIAINAVAQLGESCDWAGKVAESLYYSDTMRLYPGYQRDLSLLLLDYNVGGKQRDMVLRKSVVPEKTDKQYVYSTPHFNMTAIPECVPENPFYVRWLNRLGGVDYHMFSFDQEERVSVKSTQTIKPFFVENSKASGSDRTYDIKAERSITVGSENISAQEYRILSEIGTSPCVEWYNEGLGRWQTVNVAKADNKFNSHHKQHSFEIEFDLPALNLQFA